MNTRLVISLLFAGALAFACGPRPHTDLATGLTESRDHSLLNMMVSARPHRSESAKSSNDNAKNAPAVADAPKLNAHLDVTRDRNTIHFTLAVTNIGAKRVELTFPSGKAYDFVVLDSLEREVWHWSNGRLFTQAVQNKLLSRGESMRVEEEWKTPAKPGHYTAVGLVNSTNFPIQQRVDFTLP